MIYRRILDIIGKKGAAYVVLIDPDFKNENKIEELVFTANESDVDMIFVGGSFSKLFCSLSQKIELYL